MLFWKVFIILSFNSMLVWGNFCTRLINRPVKKTVTKNGLVVKEVSLCSCTTCAPVKVTHFSKMLMIYQNKIMRSNYCLERKQKLLSRFILLGKCKWLLFNEIINECFKFIRNNKSVFKSNMQKGNAWKTNKDRSKIRQTKCAEYRKRKQINL